MAKYIKMTPEIKAECRSSFMLELDKLLSANKFVDGKLSLTQSFDVSGRKAHIYITETAWLKITSLLREFSKEVAWHATAYRVPDKDEYIIKDVLVYPQTVTAATVDMDEEEYAKWLQTGIMSGDERFDDIHCQMHSHVNMGVFASGTDIQHQEEILNQLKDDSFYIFMIWNKSLNVYIRIFDMQKNILFESADCSYSVMEDNTGINKFIADAKKIVREYKPAPITTSFTGSYDKNYVYTPESFKSPYSPTTSVKQEPEKPSKKKAKKKTKTKFVACKNACDEQLRVYDEYGAEFDISDPFAYYDGRFQIT